MKVVTLGTGEAFDENYANNSHVVMSSRTNLMLDCGDSAVRKLWEFNDNPEFLDALYITHRHSDHLFGVPALVARMKENGRQKPLSIICGEDLVQDIERICEHAYFGVKSYGYEVNFIKVHDSGVVDYNDLQLRFAKTLHTAYDLAIRIDNGRNVVSYSGDGPFDSNTVSLYKGSNLLIHEAYTWNRTISGHVRIDELIKMAKDSGVRCLALTHMKRDFRRDEYPYLKDMILGQGTLDMRILVPESLEEIVF